MTDNLKNSETSTSADGLSWDPIITTHESAVNYLIAGTGPDRLEFLYHTGNLFSRIFFFSFLLSMIISGINFIIFINLGFYAPAAAAAFMAAAAGVMIHIASSRDYSANGGLILKAAAVFDAPLLIDKGSLREMAFMLYGSAALLLLFFHRKFSFPSVKTVEVLLFIFLLAFISAIFFFAFRKLTVFDRAKRLVINGKFAPLTTGDIEKLKNPGFMAKFIFGNVSLPAVRRTGTPPLVIEFDRLASIQLISLNKGYFEIDIVYDGMTRMNALLVKDETTALEYASAIAEITGIPVLREPSPEAFTVEASRNPLITTREFVEGDIIEGAGPDRLEFKYYTNIVQLGLVGLLIGPLGVFDLIWLKLGSAGIVLPQYAMAGINFLIPAFAGFLLWKSSRRLRQGSGGPVIRARFLFDAPVFIDRELLYNLSLIMFAASLIILLPQGKTFLPLDLSIFLTLMFICAGAAFTAGHSIVVFDRARGLFINGRLAPENNADIDKLKNTGFITKYFFSNEKVSWLKDAGRVPCVIEFSRITAVQLLDRDTHQEINIIYDGRERTNVIVTRSLKRASLYAEKIAEFVKVPLQASRQMPE